MTPLGFDHRGGVAGALAGRRVESGAEPEPESEPDRVADDLPRVQSAAQEAQGTALNRMRAGTASTGC